MDISVQNRIEFVLEELNRRADESAKELNRLANSTTKYGEERRQKLQRINRKSVKRFNLLNQLVEEFRQSSAAEKNEIWGKIFNILQQY